ncbi:MAG: 16S rRNA (guanine(966)-N(2))-methyltransferase RsmD [Ruminococcaceae bacterium]|nr:16S rRNA (guanine(966)-N(2))-methyltransferase RsmD [Oscillospiraceae bacterium]
MMRVITGSAKGIRLQTPEGETTRPTSERAKEAFFSMIQFEIVGRRVLDLFAGSGQLGIEALSRGAKTATFTDSSKAAIQAVRANLKKTGFEGNTVVYAGDALTFLRGRAPEKYDLVFLDPPYALGLVPQALELLCKGNLLLPGALLLCETGESKDVFGGNGELEKRFTVRSLKKHGVAHLTLLVYSETEVSP